MRLIPRSRIGLRLVASFATLLALLIGLAGITLYRMQQVSMALDRSSEHLENLTLVAEIGAHAEASARKLLVLISADREQRVRAYQEIDAANVRLDAAMQRLDARLPDGERRAQFLVIGARLIAYRASYGLNVDLIEAGDVAAARRMLVDDTEVALARLASARDAFTRFEHAAATTQAQSIEAHMHRDRSFGIALCLAGLAVGASLAAWATRSIVRPLLDAEAVAHRMIAGDYAQQIAVTQDDEVGRVSAALNTLACTIGEREATLRRLSHTDALTGLAQRGRFVEEGQSLLDGLAGTARPAALLCMDIDRLKLINAVLGFDAGDAAIIDAARRIAAVIGAQGCVSRVAGGTFAAVLPVDGADDAQALAARLQAEVERKVSWHSQALDLSLSIGIALCPDHASGCESLLRHAEQAMFEAKRRRLATAVYVPSLEAARLSHLTLLSELAVAIEQGQLRMHLQPKVSPRDGRLLGAEALVRWQHPQRGWVSPGEFIPFAESTGRIRQVTQWMLERAVQTLAVWQRNGTPLAIAVNVSTLDLQDTSLPARVERLLRAAGVAPHWLQIELTETGLLTSGPDPIAVLHALRDIGVGLAIDDFGTGQSSLSYLQRLPVHELKIDRSFVDGFDTDSRRRELLGSIVSLGHSLGLVVTAEGVERSAELASLSAMGCDQVQGFLIARPIAADAFDAWRAAWQGIPAVARLKRVASEAPA